MGNKKTICTWTVAIMILVLAVSVVTAEPDAGTYVVNDNGSAADNSPGDGLCATAGGVCTLRAALEEANLDNAASLIKFAAPMNISYPLLPALTEGGTTIDASEQWDGAWPNGEPGVTISGGDPVLAIHSDGNVIRGLEFSGNSVQILIEFDGGANTIGGPDQGQRNVFLGGIGVEIQSTDFGNTITGNYFGTRDGLTLVPSTYGVYLSSDGNFVEDNLIVGQVIGVFIGGGNNNFIQNGNLIGSNKLQSGALANDVGVSIVDGDYNIVWNNLIAGNTGHGVELVRADNNSVIQNVVGNSLIGGNGGDGIHARLSNNNQFGKSLYGNSLSNNGGYGLWLNGQDNTIQDNDISGNLLDGVHVDDGQGNSIGGAGETLGNVIGDNGGDGIYLSGTVISTTVQGNYIGLSSGAFDAGNGGHGIFLDDGANQNHLGGLGTGEGNWIAWNALSGIYLTGANTHDNVLEGNVIGAPTNWGWVAPNGNHGISIYDGAHNNWIGWNNTVVASSWSGVAIVNSDDNVVWLNHVGTNSNDEDWGNSYYGVAVVNSAGNTIFGNDIGFNGRSSGQAGVRIDGGLSGNPINANSIHDNVGPGIELVNGGNFGLGAPSITQANCQAQPQGQTEVKGTSCPDCQVEIFSDEADEGRIYEGTTTADSATGAFTWNGMLHGPNVTATATLTTSGATSAFSASYAVGACIVPQLFIPFVVAGPSAANKP